MPPKTRSVSLGGARRIARLPPGAEDATPERLAHAARTGAAGVEAGVRRLADPFDLLRKRQLLDRVDPAGNDRLWEIGERFRHHWHRSRLDGLAAFDFSRDLIDGTSRGGEVPTEAATRHRAILRKAAAAVGPRLLPILTGIAVDGLPALAMTPLIKETAHARTAEALVIERLRESLHRLGDHWGMTDGPRRGSGGRRAVSPARSPASGYTPERGPRAIG